MFLCPFAWGGSLYFVDEPPQQQPQEEAPRPLFDHPELDPGYQEQEIYYFQDQKYTESVIYKKVSSYMDMNYGYSDLTVSSVLPYYYPCNYTQQTTSTSTSSNGTTTESTATMQVNESFSIQNAGTYTVDYQEKSASPSQQYFLQFNAISRDAHFGWGIEMSYNNNPLITLTNPWYIINRTITSTQDNTQTTGTGSSSTYPAPSTVQQVTANVTLNTLSLKVVNVPIHLTMQYFPIYDGYFQPYLKFGIGANFTYTKMSVTENNDASTRGTLAPLYQTGWAFKPFTYTYGAGLQIMLTESLALTCSYLKQGLQGRSTKFTVIVNSSDPSQQNANGSYGDMRFEFKEKTTLKEIGLAYYF